MPGGGFIPSADVDFDAWLTQYASYAGVHVDEIGLTAADLATLNAAQIQWSTDFVANTAAQATAKQAVTTKNTSRKAVEAIVRGQVKRVQVNPTTTDTDRQGLGITIPGTTPSGGELPYQEKPAPEIDMNEHLVHNVKVYTMTATGPKRGKPEGAMGIEVRRTIGDAPSSPNEMEVVGTMTATKFAIEYPGSAAGQLVHYAMRWVSYKGEPGSWSDIKSATVAAA